MGYNQRYDAKTDKNHTDLVSSIRDIPNYSVSDLSGAGGGVPDLLLGGDMPCPCCGFKFKQNKLAEIKRELVKGKVFASQSKLNPLQVEWHDTWLGQVAVVRTLDDVLEVMGIK
jgi:hypothetical protein